MTSMLLTAIRLLSVYWDYVSLLEPLEIALVHVVAIFVYVQILDTIPKLSASTPSPADILFIAAGCILMLASFVHLLTRSRTLGSSFLLPLATLCCTGLALTFSLRIAIALDMRIHPTSLAHVLPFLVAIIGFDKPVRVAQAVFQTPLACTLFHCPNHSPPAGSPIPIILLDSFVAALPNIIGEYFFEIKVLALAAYLPFGALRQFCALAALTLAVHYLLFSYFFFILALILRGCVLRIANDIKAIILNSRVPSKPSYLSLSFLLGEKGTSLYNPKYSFEAATLRVNTNSPVSENEHIKNPPLRLKLLIFSSFLLFNFIAPFTPFTLSHHPTNPISNIISSPLKLYPATPTTPVSPAFSRLSTFFYRLCPSRDLESLILPEHFTLSIAFLAMLALNVLLSISVAVFQASVVGPGGLVKLLLGREEEKLRFLVLGKGIE